MKSYKELQVWKSSMELSIEVYQLTKDFPKSEMYGLTSQLRRAVVSLPSNIAEGHQDIQRKSLSSFYILEMVLFQKLKPSWKLLLG